MCQICRQQEYFSTWYNGHTIHQPLIFMRNRSLYFCWRLQIDSKKYTFGPRKRPVKKDILISIFRTSLWYMYISVKWYFGFKINISIPTNDELVYIFNKHDFESLAFNTFRYITSCKTCTSKICENHIIALRFSYEITFIVRKLQIMKACHATEWRIPK